MRKTDKKLDNQLRLVLTDVCETALKKINGFLWLTHLVNYSDFPQSLKIVCVFDNNEHLANFMLSSRTGLESLIQVKLAEINIHLKKRANQISYDTEESCDHEHHGNWSDRLR